MMMVMMKMLLPIYCMLVVITQYKSVWAQQAFDVLTFLPRHFPPPAVFNKVVNDSVFVFVGEPIAVGEDIRVTIDCSQLIDNAISNGTKNPTVTWYDNTGRPAVDGRTAYAEISADGRQCIFPRAFMPVGAHLPIDGNYTCEVCSDPDTCVNRSTMFTVCGVPHLYPPTSPPAVSPFIISLTCGQDIILPSLVGVTILHIWCNIFNTSYSYTKELFKDGMSFDEFGHVGTLGLHLFYPDDDDFGTYTFLLSTEACGHTFAVSRILRQVPVGQSVTVKESKHVIIDCGSPIDDTVAGGVTTPDVAWYKDGLKITNGSVNNVVISENERQCIITEASPAVGSKPGNNGNYTCEVCSDPSTCTTRTTSVHVCGIINETLILPPTNPPIITPHFVSVACGQNVTLPSSRVANLSLSCSLVNSTEPITTEVFKDGVSIGSTFTRSITPFGDDDFGTYTFVASNKGCNEVTAMTRILRKEPLIGGGQCVPQPEVIPPTDMTVAIGTPVYIVDGYDLTIACNIINGTTPITISWYRNGVVDSSKENVSAITISNVDINKDDGVVYTCRADNAVGYDTEYTSVNVFTPPCSHDVCRSRKSILCIIPDSTCLCKPQLGYCSAAYYSTRRRTIPETCTICENPTDVNCLRIWSSCVKQQDEADHGRPRRRMRTAANFRIYTHPC